MDETSYSDARVIARINEAFVPVRADNDRNPDVNRRYNMGGWPTTVFLAANGDVHHRRHLPPAWADGADARTRVRVLCGQPDRALALDASSTPTPPTPRRPWRTSVGRPMREVAPGDGHGEPGLPGDIPAAVALEIVRAFDPLHGGLGTDQKFPQADAFVHLLAFGALRPDDDAVPAARISQVARTTLTNMATGDLYDGVAGGFFRYSTQRDWSEPHYEKMLEDNTRLAALYLDAAEIAACDDGALGSASFYHDIAEGVIDYLLATCSAKTRRASAAARTPTRATTASAPRSAPSWRSPRRPDRLRGLERAGGPCAAPGGAAPAPPGARCASARVARLPLGARAPDGAMAHYVLAAEGGAEDAAGQALNDAPRPLVPGPGASLPGRPGWR